MWKKIHVPFPTVGSTHPPPPGTLDYFMWESYPSGLLNIGGSTQNNALRVTWGLPPLVKAGGHHMTFTLLARLQAQQNKETKNTFQVSNFIHVDFFVFFRITLM